MSSSLKSLSLSFYTPPTHLLHHTVLVRLSLHYRPDPAQRRLPTGSEYIALDLPQPELKTGIYTLRVLSFSNFILSSFVSSYHQNGSSRDNTSTYAPQQPPPTHHSPSFIKSNCCWPPYRSYHRHLEDYWKDHIHFPFCSPTEGLSRRHRLH